MRNRIHEPWARFAALALLGFGACSTTLDRSAVPDLAPTRVVPLSYVSAEEAAEAICESYAQRAGAGKLQHPNCRHGGGNATFDASSKTVWLYVTTDPRTNSLIIAATADHAVEIDHALEIVRVIDVPKTTSTR